ncbi:hypothetical protein R69749_07461 [Paraburkholderia domus]|uniref:Uncharacterized protein n=1 Tax=Paraburkholderia domus TaxID=2793075 RepID=A0A9N8NEH7_9BURK|nr:hypothetical protein R70006_08018 [Paraburkholderia domus]CAE6888430.1 hypothetical protein R69749_07461 [Paraburkholderia domus]CAE6964399.1 hypothetical protein R70211_07221 [Paraburkholderia domus]CAE6967060.1 hypothetical protein R70199_07806 [Paraburkholderia domus]
MPLIVGRAYPADNRFKRRLSQTVRVQALFLPYSRLGTGTRFEPIAFHAYG